MTQPAIRVEGLNLLTRKLKALDEKLPGEVREMNARAGETTEGFVRPLVPVQDGTLVGSLRHGASKRVGYVAIGRAAVPYAGPVNFGWPAHNIEAQNFMDRGLTAAEPFVVPQYELEVAVLTRKVGLA